MIISDLNYLEVAEASNVQGGYFIYNSNRTKQTTTASNGSNRQVGLVNVSVPVATATSANATTQLPIAIGNVLDF